MKLLQWNVWYKEDINNILKVIQGIDPDIICLQELTVNHPDFERFNRGVDTPKYLAEKLNFNHFYKNAHDDPVNMFGSGIFSRFPIIQSTATYIKESHGSYKEHRNYSDQARMYIECLIDTGEKKLSIATTHMSFTDAFSPTPEKEVETQKLIAIIKNKKNDYILTGDFNALPGSYTISEVEKYLKNAGPSLDQKTWTTKPFSYNGFTGNTLDWRLDYCFTTPDIDVRSAQILKTEYSDHLPILIEF
jgi:endonuclease/exonuclease/phosphatase family metal-dependent hydrolase